MSTLPLPSDSKVIAIYCPRAENLSSIRDEPICTLGVESGDKMAGSAARHQLRIESPLTINYAVR